MLKKSQSSESTDSAIRTDAEADRARGRLASLRGRVATLAADRAGLSTQIAELLAKVETSGGDAKAVEQVGRYRQERTKLDHEHEDIRNALGVLERDLAAWEAAAVTRRAALAAEERDRIEIEARTVEQAYAGHALALADLAPQLRDLRQEWLDANRIAVAGGLYPAPDDIPRQPVPAVIGHRGRDAETVIRQWLGTVPARSAS